MNEPFHMDVCITLMNLPSNADINDILKDIENAANGTVWGRYIDVVREDF